ncbi:MAG: PaaI family thioesterase [Acidimicrobiales bacterium]
MTENRTRTYSWDDPAPSAAAARSMSGLDFLKAITAGEIAAPPIAVTLGFTIAEFSDGEATFVGTPHEWHYNPIGVVHGGYAATLLDSALGCAVQSTLPAGTGYTTAELTVNLVRPITTETGELRSEARVLHRGSRLATAEAKLLDGNGRLYAHATTTCLILNGDRR